jgi:hypothetical protein
MQRICAKLDHRGTLTPFKEGKRLDKNQSAKTAVVSPVKPLSAIVALEEDIKMNQSRRRLITKTQTKRGSDQKRPKEDNRGIKKEYFGSDSSCRVTFRLPKEAVGAAGGVVVVGDFNDWDKKATPMKRLRSGDFEITIALGAGKEYRFRYLIDGSRWENDWCADNYYPNSYGCDDSVLII